MRGSGFFVNETAGEALPIHTVVYRGVDSNWYLADADLAAQMPVIGITISAIPANRRGRILLQGYIGDNTWTWTAGDDLYVSQTPGQLTNAAPAAPAVQQIVGNVVTQTLIYFNSDLGSGAGGGGGGACLLLEGHTAYVGFDSCKNVHTNYWTCDGVADNVQIQAAINYASGIGGGSVYLENGTYDIAATITVPNGISVIGDTWYTQLILANNVDDNMFEGSATNRNGVQFRNLWLHGNKANNAATSNGIYFNGLTISRFENLFVRDFNDNGIEVIGGSANVYTNEFLRCRVTNCDRNGIRYLGNEGHFTDIQCALSGISGIELLGGTHNTIKGGNFEGNTQDGIKIGSGFHNTLTGATFSGATTLRQIYVTSSSYCTITGNTIREGVDGIVIWAGAAVAAEYNMVLGNVVRDCTSVGIRERTSGASVDYNVIKNNKIINCTTVVTILGADTAVHEWFETVENPDANIGRHPAEQMLDTVETTVRLGYQHPLEFQEVVTAQIVIVSAAAGNLRWAAFTDFGKLCATEDYNTHSDTVGATTTAVLADDLTCIDVSAALTGIAAGDRVGLEFWRDGDNALDTINDTVYVLGFRLRYV